MSDRELKRRQTARNVFLEAWDLQRRTTVFAYSFSMALRLCWQTVRSMLHFRHSKVKGTTFSNRQKLLSRLRAYNCHDVIMSLVREPANEYDPNAVQIWVHVRGRGDGCIGYLAKEIASGIAPQLDEGRQVIALFDGITGDGTQYLGCNFRYLPI